MLAALEPLIHEARPDVLLVYGDTNSTLAGALAGAQHGVPVAHVEAGMRSYDRTMPEELNRVLADHASSLLLCSSERAAETLRPRLFDGRPLRRVTDGSLAEPVPDGASTRELLRLSREHRAEAVSMRAVLFPDTIAVIGASRRSEGCCSRCRRRCWNTASSRR